MIEAIRRHLRCADSLARVEKTACIKLIDTPRGDRIERLFLELSKPKVFSDEASFAMMLLLYSNAIQEEVRNFLAKSESPRGEHYPDTMLRYGLIWSVLKPLIIQMEKAAPDRDRWNEKVGDDLKSYFNHLRKQSEDSAERRNGETITPGGSRSGRIVP